MARQCHRALLALCSLTLLCLAQSKIHNSAVDKDERKLVPLTEAFGFADGGKIDITISNIFIWQKHTGEKAPNLDNFGFFLSPVEADATLEADLSNPDKCILSEISNLFTFKDSGVQQVMRHELQSFTFHFAVENGGLFYLYFANCELDMPVSFDSRIELYNLDRSGRKDYLSVGETELEEVFWVSAPSSHLLTSYSSAQPTAGHSRAAFNVASSHQGERAQRRGSSGSSEPARTQSTRWKQDTQ